MSGLCLTVPVRSQPWESNNIRTYPVPCNGHNRTLNWQFLAKWFGDLDLLHSVSCRRNQIITGFIVLQYLPPCDAFADDHILEEYCRWQINNDQVRFGGVLAHYNAVSTAWSFQGASTCRKPGLGGFSAVGTMHLTNWTSYAASWIATQKPLKSDWDTQGMDLTRCEGWLHITWSSSAGPGLYWLSNPRFHEDC